MITDEQIFNEKKRLHAEALLFLCNLVKSGHDEIALAAWIRQIERIHLELIALIK